MLIHDLKLISQLYKNGDIFIYPTEYIYGIGCDPDSQTGLDKIYSLKNRDKTKGFILISSSIDYLNKYIDKDWLTPERKEILIKTNIPTTFIVKAAENINPLLTGDFKGTIAVRISKMPLIKELCLICGGALVSTSANLTGLSPTNNYLDLIDFSSVGILQGKTQFSNTVKGSKIINLINNKVIRN